MGEIEPDSIGRRNSGRSSRLLPRQGERVLLISPPVYDTRLHWSKWQQPTLLLKLAAYCRKVAADARLVDTSYSPPGERLRRERVSILDVDGSAVNRWRFGPTRYALAGQLRALAKGGWQPDAVYVECFTTFWWEGAAETIRVAKERFPRSRVVLVGAYADLAPEHAKGHTDADEIGVGPCPLLAAMPTDLSLYPRAPNFAYVSVGNGARDAADVVAEVEDKASRWKVKHFAFAENAIASRFPELYRAVLEQLAARRLGVILYAFGNISPSDLASSPDLAGLMKQAGFAQVYFADDRDAPIDSSAGEQLAEDYREATVACHRAGFRPRSDALNAALSIGRPGEDLAARAGLATLVAHHVGSVILTPYQPAPAECPGMPLEDQNGKLFPLRRRNGHTYRDYLDVMGLAAVLNAKYRTHTFDFLGDGLIPRMFRSSIAREAWDPDPGVKGSLRLPVLERR